MSRRSLVVRYFNPWAFRREEREQHLAALRQRDGDSCRRCRKPLRFDLPQGHDKAPAVVPILTLASAGGGLDNLCLCHARCNADSGDNTQEVEERLRLRA